MRLLAIDTATSAITVAVHDGGRVLAEQSALDPRRHAELLAPLVRDVLGEAGVRPADLTGIAVGTGPGPFTGLRVGLVTAQTMGHALSVPVHGVCSLDALAHSAALDGTSGRLLVATDARRREVYWAVYELGDSRATRTTEPAVTRPAELPEDVRSLPAVGRGPLIYPDDLLAGREPLDVAAGALADLAVLRVAAGEDMPTDPLYLRRPDAASPAVPKSALAAGGPPRQRRRRRQQEQAPLDPPASVPSHEAEQ